MPEGHTIHRLARRHKRLFGRRKVSASSPQGRFAEGAAAIDGRVLRGTDAHGKHLLHDYGGLWLHVHLGLYGRFDDGPLPAPDPRGQLRLRLSGETAWADLRGPTACEVFDEAQVDALHARLGPDPLRADADPDQAYRRIGRSRVAIGALLMQQEVVAGIGNVYRAEVLYRAGVDPLRPGRDVDEATWRGMWDDLVALMAIGVRRGRIETLRPEDQPARPGRGGRRDRGARSYVYHRAGLPCRVCGTEVRTAVMVARNLFWCPYCQR